MKIQVQAVHFHADEKLLEFVEERLSKLSRVFENIIEAEVFLRLQDTGGKIQDKIAEIKLHLPGAIVMDKKVGTTFENAILVSVDSIKRQVQKRKEKVIAKHHARL
jgi:putative sigma-54 modulation protein